MSKLFVKDDSGFFLDLYLIKLSLTKVFLSKPTKVLDERLYFKLDNKHDFYVEGDFNAKGTTGSIEKVIFYEKGQPVLVVTDTNVTLQDLIAAGSKDPAQFVSALLNEDSYLFGGKGDDILSSEGVTRFFGGTGNDAFFDDLDRVNHYDGETGSDTVVYEGDSNTLFGVTASLLNPADNKEEAEGDTYRSIENLVGTIYDDTLIGNARANKLSGAEGSDILVGDKGADILKGGEGDDYASYRTTIAVNGIGVVASLADPSLNRGDAKGDKYDSIEGLIGSSGNDTLTGDSHDNTIYGAAGDDVIDGGGGNDELWGDSEEFGTDGSDTFVFNGPSAADLKRIMDFDVFDHVQVSRSGFGLHPLWQLGVGTTLIIAHANPAAATNSPTFLVEQSTGNLYFDADGNGSGAKELIANIQFHSQEYLDVNDFVIVA